MPQTAVIRKAMESVKQRFGDKARGNPPATAEQLDELQAYVGPLSYEFTTYLSEHNGLRIDRGDGAVSAKLWDVEEILSIWAGYDSAALPERLAPISGDPKGRRDWLILNEGDLHGAVLRWDPWRGKAEVIASSLASYIDAWAGHLCKRNGQGEGPEFDAEYVAERDKTLSQLRCAPDALARRIDKLGLVPAGKGCPRE